MLCSFGPSGFSDSPVVAITTWRVENDSAFLGSAPGVPLCLCGASGRGGCRDLRVVSDRGDTSDTGDTEDIRFEAIITSRCASGA